LNSLACVEFSKKFSYVGLKLFSLSGLFGCRFGYAYCMVLTGACTMKFILFKMILRTCIDGFLILTSELGARVAQ
jgi:hypothetical protein